MPTGFLTRALVVLGLLAATVFATLPVAGDAQAKARGAERDRLHQATVVIERIVQEAKTGLAGTAGLYESSREVSGEEFGRFVGRLLRDQPALNAISLTERVPEAERPAWERRTGLRMIDPARGGTTSPSPRRSVHFPISRLARQPGVDGLPLGTDVAADPSRVATIEDARRSGDTRASGIVTALATGGRALVLYHPVLGSSSGASSDPAPVLIGVVAGVFRLERLEQAVRDALPVDVEVRVSDDGAPVIGGAGPGGGPSQTLAVAGREWQVQLASGVGASWGWTALVGAGGLLLTLCVALLLVQGTRRERYAECLVAARLAERMQVEDELRQERDLAETLLASLHEGLVVNEPDGTIIQVNRRFCEMTGFAREELIGLRPPFPHWPADQHARIAEILERFGTGGAREFDVVFQRRDGKRFPAILAGALLPPGPQGGRSVWTILEVTERHEAQAALRASEQRFRLLAENAGDLIASHRPSGALLYLSPACERLLGHAPDDLVGRLPAGLVHPADAPALEAGLAAAAAGEDAQVVARWRRRDGEEVWLETSLRAARGTGGEEGEVHSVSRDITERRRAEAEAERSRRFLEALLENLSDGVAACDPGGRLAVVNRAAFELHGLPLGRIDADSWRSGYTLSLPDGTLLTPLVDCPFGRAHAGESMRDVEVVITHADGERRRVLVSGQAITGVDGEALGAVIAMRDITERAVAEEALRRSKHFLEATLESLFDGVVACDAEGTLALVNRATRQFVGLGAEPLTTEGYGLYQGDGRTPLPRDETPLARAFRGEDVRDVTVVIAPEGAPRRLVLASGRPILDADGSKLGAVVAMQDVTERRRAEDALEGANRRLESILAAAGEGICGVDPLGRIVYANPAAAALLGHDRDGLVGRNLAELVGAPLNGAGEPTPATFRRADGTSLAAEYVRSSVVEAGRPAGAVVVFRDVGERNELERMKNEFVAVASHELRTPLTSVLGYLQLVLGEDAGALNREQRRLLEVAERRGQQLAALVSDIHTLARADAGRLRLESRPVDLCALAAEVVDGFRASAGDRGIALLYERPADPLRIEADPIRLGQVLDNLISNALKFTPPGGVVELRLGRRPAAAAIEVSDTGIGIPPEEQAGIFERFFRARAAGERAIQGTGLGLAIVQTVVEAHGGAVRVESREGVGTTFTVELPGSPPAYVLSSSRREVTPAGARP